MLWAITSYFNPAGYQSRRANYRIFRKHLNVPLLAIELSFSGRRELAQADADILVQITGGDVMWQKERLLNLALRHLPPDCDTVAWVDCDVIMSNRNWPQQASEALRDFALVQLFGERCGLARGAIPVESSGWGPIESRRLAIGRALGEGWKMPDHSAVTDAGAIVAAGAPYPGLAWAARRSLLERHGLYDACIVGGGDWALTCAALGAPEYCTQMMTTERMEHYVAWARPFFGDVGGRIGYLEGRVFHLWHGSSEDRSYSQRQVGLSKLGYDPFTDIAVDAQGCWRWNSNKPALHDYVKNYFISRREDAPGP